jgi:hypothetical protein
VRLLTFLKSDGMKKYILTLFIGLTCTLNAQKIELKVNNVKQEQTEWCTVAASKCVLDYYKTGIYPTLL